MNMPVEVTDARNSTTLVVLVENKAGVLARVADLFARRGFNIVSLAVAPTANDQLSRITIVVDGDQNTIDQITKQLFKLINVVEIAQVEPTSAIQRELLIATLEIRPSERSQIVDLVTIFQGKVVGVGSNHITVSMEAGPLAVDNFEALLADYTIVDMQRSGLVALPKIGSDVRRLRAV